VSRQRGAGDSLDRLRGVPGSHIRQCWRCDQLTLKGHYCELCGADLWNPPRDAGSASSRLVEHVARQEVTPMVTQRGSSRTATAGIIIIATLMAFTFWFWFGIGLAGAVNPPETVPLDFGVEVRGDYLSTCRVWFALIVSVVSTVITWAVALEVASDRME